MDPTMYIFLNKGLGMSTGKAAAQAGHAAVEAYRITTTGMRVQWYIGGHYKKLVMEAKDSTHLFTIERYLNDRGFSTKLIIDEGLTEIAAHTATALGVQVVDKDVEHVRATFELFKLYREQEPDTWQDPGKPNDEKDTSWPRFSTVFSNVIRGRNRG